MAFTKGEDPRNSRLRAQLEQFLIDEGSSSLLDKLDKWIPALEEIQELCSFRDQQDIQRILNVIRSVAAKAL